MSSRGKRLELLLIAVASAGPLLAFAVWAYLPAQPHAYPSLEALLLNTYRSAASPLPAGAMNLRLAALLSLVVFALVLMRGSLLSRSGAAFAGVLSSALLVSPQLVPFAMQGEGVASAVLWTGVWLLAVLFTRRLLSRLGAAAAPLAALLILLGFILSVRSAAEVVLRSEPPLFVLAEAARAPDSSRAQLALGMHLLAIGGEGEAQPVLRAVGARLEARYAKEGRKDLLEIASYLARWTPDAMDLRPAQTQPEKGEH